MKKFFTGALVALAILTAGSSNAQTMKIGYISVDNMVYLMPDIGKIDTLLSRYSEDSIGPQYRYLASEYNRKDSMVNTKDSVKYRGAVGQQIRAEMAEILSTLQNWQQISDRAIEAKQNELLRPVYNKVYEAIKVVAKAKGYTHVFNKEAFLVAPEGDDMILDVAKQLKVTVPNQTGTKPPVRPGN